MAGRRSPSPVPSMEERWSPSNSRLLGSGRLSSQPNSTGLAPNPNVFSDEYRLEPLDGMDDSNVSRVSSPAMSLNRSRNSVSTTEDEEDDNTSPTSSSYRLSPFRDSMRKSMSNHHPHHHPQLSTDSDSSSTLTETPRAASPATRRNNSTTQRTVSSASRSSRFSFPLARNSYHGPTGPSHPYAMYPQVTGLTRTSSISSSTVTVQPTDMTNLQGGGQFPPQHPYNLYPQSTVLEEGVDGMGEAAIPLGFPGHVQSYRAATEARRDDVGDIVGPDGHTEQLPAYSLYPDGLEPKQESLTGPGLDLLNSPTSNMIPESGSQTLLVGDGRRPARSQLRDQPSRRDDPDKNFMQRMQRKGKRKVCCGVPLWVWIIVGSILTLGAVIGAGVIGGLLGSAQDEAAATSTSDPSGSNPTATVTVTATTILDATPLPSDPGNLPPAPNGKFTIPALDVKQSDNCVIDPKFDITWACLGRGGIRCTLDHVSHRPKNINIESATINGSFTYGAQLPIFSNSDFSLKMMLDKTAPSKGPALFGFTTFDKLVIIPEDKFPVMHNKKRHIREEDLLRHRDPFHIKQIAKAGDKPWFCWWNSTFLEVFIYLTEPATGTVTTPASYYSTTPSPPPSQPTSSTSVPHPAVPGATPGPQLSPRQYDGDDHDYSTSYPLQVKLKEKRDNRSGVKPYCNQMLVRDDGTLVDPRDPTTSIGESDDNSDSGTTDDTVVTTEKRSNHFNNCFCEWNT